MKKSILFVTWAGGGNVSPFLGLAQRLQAGGHEVTALATAVLRDRFVAAGIARVDTSQGWLPTADEVIVAVERHQPNLIVIDYMLAGGLCGAETTSTPTVALVHTLYTSLLDDGTPNPMFMSGSVADLNKVRATLDLDPVEAFGDLLLVCDQVLVAAPAELDLPLEVPKNVRYVGALSESLEEQTTWQPPDGHDQLILISVGTAGDPERETQLLKTIFQAIERLPVQGLATVADYIDRTQLQQAKNVTVSGYVPHSKILPHADLLITHGGLGSVLAALTHAVPMICLPLDRDQPDNAEAVERVGAGAAADPAISPTALRQLIESELAQPRTIRFSPEPWLAVELLETLMG